MDSVLWKEGKRGPQFALAPLLGGLPVAAAPILLLDGLSNLAAAYSFRKLRTDYAGDCVRIRASGDSAEANFGFVDDVVDAAGIAAYIVTHGGSPFIVTWFDQNDNALDLTQATAGTQPAFIASGINSLPTARFTADELAKASVAAASLTNGNEGTVLVVAKQAGANAQNGMFGFAPSDVFHYYATYEDVLYFDFGTTGAGGRVNVAQPGGWDDAPHISELYRETGGTQAIIIDGTSLVSGSRSDTVSGTASWRMGTNNISFAGDISELVVFKSDIGATHRATIRKNGISAGVADGMGDYYGITVA